jgi:hypothetical protein
MLAEKFIDTDAKATSLGLAASLTDLLTLKKNSARFARCYSSKASTGHFANSGLTSIERLNDMVYQMPTLSSRKASFENRAICMTSVGNRVEFSALMCDALPDLHMADKNGASQCFPLYLYEKGRTRRRRTHRHRRKQGELIDGYRRRERDHGRDSRGFPRCLRSQGHEGRHLLLRLWRAAFAGVSDALCQRPEEDAAAHPVHAGDGGLLEVQPRRARPRAVASELRDGRALSRAGAHQRPRTRSGEGFSGAEDGVWPEGQAGDKTVIAYNSQITLTGIPLEAYDYVVNGKPAIEWIMERYQVTRDKDSGIPNDPNDWSREHQQPRYIVDLLKRVITREHGDDEDREQPATTQ